MKKRRRGSDKDEKFEDVITRVMKVEEEEKSNLFRIF